jgi:cell division inhibitor SepF
MGKFKSIFKKFLGFEDDLFEEEEENSVDLEAELNKQKSYYGAKDHNEPDTQEKNEDLSVRNQQNSPNQKLNESYQNKQRQEIVMYPKIFGEACDVVEKIELGYVVIVDMDDIEIDTCKRIADFVLGAVYVLEGDVEKVSKKVFKFWLDK